MEIFRKAIIVLVIIAILQFNYGSAPAIHKSAKPPNIIIFLVDDMGFSDPGCYGGEIQTPVLDSLAMNGLRFTQFYNTGRSWPTRASILTGYYAQQVNMDGRRAAFPKWGYLLPHHLRQAGYRSYHSGKWHVSTAEPILSNGGFDRSFNCDLAWDYHFSPKPEYLFLDDQPFSELPGVSVDKNYYSSTAIADYSLKFLREHQALYSDSPFFLYTAFLAPHFPLHAHQEDIDKYRDRYLEGWEELKKQRSERQRELGFDYGENSPFEYYVTSQLSWSRERLRDSIPGEIYLPRPWEQLTEEEKILQATKMAIHAAMVDRMDQEIGRIMNYLKETGEDRNTLVLFLSDNGADATVIIRGDGHDRYAVPGSAETYLSLGPGFSTASNTPFRRHKIWVHEGGIITPLIAYWPDGIKAKGEFRNAMGHVIDLLPTILDIAGVEPLMERNGIQAPPLPGQSLVPLFKKDQSVDRELFFSHVGNKALRQGKWKAVYSPYVDGKWQLYDMEADRTELNDLSSPFPESLMRVTPRWRETRQDLLDKMKERWEYLDELYQKQGK